ncbi:exonuclease [Paraglaciecola Antarctic GD virus 1]|nr:exonuclease [Paraglaciecola Antarctic GD virus 1]
MIHIDFETLGTSPTGMIVSLAMVHFPDVGDEEEWAKLLIGGAFETLVENNSEYIKFELKGQKGVRSFDSEVAAWWKKQGPEASNELLPSPRDVTLADALPIIEKFFTKHFKPKEDLLYSRGNAFDISLFEDYLLQQKYVPFGLFRFWNVRDVRTDIGSVLMNRKMDKCHVRKDQLKGFIHHNPVHDCCKDIVMMYFAQQYSLGHVDYPTQEESHEVTLDTR